MDAEHGDGWHRVAFGHNQTDAAKRWRGEKSRRAINFEPLPVKKQVAKPLGTENGELVSKEQDGYPREKAARSAMTS